MRTGPIARDLKPVRNVKPLLSHFGTFKGTLLSGLDMWLNTISTSLSPTLKHHKPDYAMLKPAKECKPIQYLKPDGKLTFDIPSSLFLSGTNHEEDQPVHLVLTDPEAPIRDNLPAYAEPAQRYCPAAVYEVVDKRRRQATLSDQRAELRSLQDLRHQRPRPEHQLAASGGRRRPELFRDVEGPRSSRKKCSLRRTVALS